ncbi:hypothetical protein [Agrobacterium pusense]|uniref:hypothetical protein n=1 Tax=Agrobacterium pusense TaxID=648995 RepID=UPI000C2D50B6|nr:hypothetical protein [Agrobacterium pusense]AUC12244.1 hypothetical protein BLX90_18355 [Rhizobium sp. Y9]MDP9772087.1 hypothetical protein [Rhizobium sp. SORGH_AS_0755]
MDKRLALQLLGACLAGGLSAHFLERNALDLPSSNIVSALSIINAAIFPTVVLSATVVKSSGMSSALIERYRSALRRQISFFFGILLFSIFTISTIIVAQAVKWHLAIDLPNLEYDLDLSATFNFLIIFFGSFVALRLPAFLRALVSLLDVHIDGVAEEVTERDQRKREDRKRELDSLPDISQHLRPPESKPIGS